MERDNNNINFNQLVKDSSSQQNDSLFVNNNDNIFLDSKKDIVSFNNMDSVFPNDKVGNNINNLNNDNNQQINIIYNGFNDSFDNNSNVSIIEIQDNNDLNNLNNTKKSIINLFNDRRVFLWLVILIFVFTSITVGKTFYLRSVVDNYEEFFIEIDEKESSEALIYFDSETADDSLKNVAASELINCINSGVDVDKLPTSVTSIIDEMRAYYNQSNNYFAFKYKDIYTGFSVSYNEKQDIFTASTIKAPKDIYIYEMASQGKINLDEKLTYTGRYANTGAWVLNNKGFNTSHTVRDLLKYSTVSSDNAAHNMLMDHFGRQNMLSFWKELGTTAIFTVNNNWGLTNAHDAAIYMEELYKFYLEDEKYGEEIMNNFLNATPKFIKGKNNYRIANKSGWAGSAVHDVSIIFADNPYILVALSNLGQTDYYMSYFNKANDLAYRLHTEYWKYKMDTCSNINQY